MSASTVGGQPTALLRYLDVALLALGAPIMLLVGVSASGYLIGAGVWIALRVVGVAVEHGAAGDADPRREVAIRLGYMLGRLFALALTIVLVRRGAGRDAGLTALLVIVFAFTIQLGISALTRPRSR
jgi:hypothetical protein